MVKISNVIPTIEVELPSLPGSKIVLRKGLTVAEQQSLGEKYPSMYAQGNVGPDVMKGSLDMLCMCIISWNLEDDDGSVLPISIDVIKKLPGVDFQFLLEKLTPEKKN